MIKQILIILTATYISDTLVRRSAVNLKINYRSEDRPMIGSPNNERQTLYCLAHDGGIVNRKGSAFPIKEATTTSNRTKIRKNLKVMLMALLKLAQQGRGIINDIISIRNYHIRNIVKTFLEVWAELLGTQINAENTRAYWLSLIHI